MKNKFYAMTGAAMVGMMCVPVSTVYYASVTGAHLLSCEGASVSTGTYTN